MMISMLAMAAAATAMQSDTTRASREAFTACLRAYVVRSMEAGLTREAFDREYPQQCIAQQQAFRNAVLARETALRATRANADEQANMEVEDSRVNFSELFEPAEPAAQARAEAPVTAGASQPQ